MALGHALDLVETGLDRLATVDVTGLPDSTVTAAIRRLGRLDGRIDGLQARMVAAAERAGVPERTGATSTTSWLARETGRSSGQAARTTKLANAGTAVPELVDEVAAGTVGPDQASRLASAMDRDELDAGGVSDLLPAARRLPPSMLGREARRAAGRRRQERLRAGELTAKDERRLATWRTDDGSFGFEGLLPPAEGDRFEKALSAFSTTDPAELPDDQRRTHRQRQADALVDLTDAALQAGAAGRVGGALPSINVLVPYEALAPLGAATDAGATAVTDLDTVLSAHEVAKLACDAAFTRVVLDPEGIPLEVGRTTRKWSSSQRTAITAIDGGCRAPGCDLPGHRCVIHHITWWRDGGETSITNGLLLCNHGHDLIHDHGWTVDLDPATRIATWTAPDGTTHTTHPRGAAAQSPGMDVRNCSDDTGALQPAGPSVGREPGGNPSNAGPNTGPGAAQARGTRGPPSTSTLRPRDRSERGPPTIGDGKPLALDL